MSGGPCVLVWPSLVRSAEQWRHAPVVGLWLDRWGQPRGDVFGGDGVFAVGRDVVFADVSGHGSPSRGQEGAIVPGAGVGESRGQEPGEGFEVGFGEALGALVLRVPRQVAVTARILR